jgi:hypothetical protein
MEEVRVYLDLDASLAGRKDLPLECWGKSAGPCGFYHFRIVPAHALMV